MVARSCPSAFSLEDVTLVKPLLLGPRETLDSSPCNVGSFSLQRMQGNLFVVPGAAHKSAALLYTRQAKRWWRYESPRTQRVHAAMASIGAYAYILVTPHLQTPSPVPYCPATAHLGEPGGSAQQLLAGCCSKVHASATMLCWPTKAN